MDDIAHNGTSYDTGARYDLLLTLQCGKSPCSTKRSEADSDRLTARIDTRYGDTRDRDLHRMPSIAAAHYFLQQGNLMTAQGCYCTVNVNPALGNSRSLSPCPTLSEPLSYAEVSPDTPTRQPRAGRGIDGGMHCSMHVLIFTGCESEVLYRSNVACQHYTL